MSSASAPVAPALIAGEIGAHAQRIEKRDARFDHEIDLLAIDVQAHWHIAGSGDRGRTLSGQFGGRCNGLGQTHDACGFKKIAAVKTHAV